VLTRSPIPSVRCARRFGASAPTLLALCLLVFSAGCGRFRKVEHETVYVSARQMYLHDRVAAVSNRVAEVVNGQPLEVLDRGRRFLKVKTQKNEIGWIEDHAVIDGKTYGTFSQLASQHQHDPVVATASVRDDVYVHNLPGRETEHFYLLPGNTKVQLLARASVPKVAATSSAPVPKPAAPKPSLNVTPQSKSLPPGAPSKAPATPASPPSEPKSASPVAAEAPSPADLVPMEDWWLVRDTQGHAGWLLAGRVDVDVPDEVGVFAEGQRMVGAYVLTRLTDPAANTPDHKVAEYVTVLSPPRAGLPFDFDQVRVFTWSLKRHRYETAFRLHPIQGFLPLTVGTQAAGAASLPVFSFQIASSDNLSVDPSTGVAHPVAPRTLKYEMIDTQVKRIGPDLAPIPVGHIEGEKPRAAKAGKSGKKKAK
jgi:hypothetical protein